MDDNTKGIISVDLSKKRLTISFPTSKNYKINSGIGDSISKELCERNGIDFRVTKSDSLRYELKFN